MDELNTTEGLLEQETAIIGSHPRAQHEPGMLLAILGVVLAAFCVWLAVRIFNRRERWAKWTAVGLAILIGYPLSWGPAIWLFTVGALPSGAVSLIYHAYAPLGWLADHSEPMRRLLKQYSDWWVQP